MLIYIQSPHSALVAKAEVLTNSVQGKPGDYAYRANTGRFELLPNRISLHDLKRKFPRWAWLWKPRGKAIVPAQYADRIWQLVHEKSPTVQILISNAGYGKRQLEKLAGSGRTAFWSAPKLTRFGDAVLFYVEEPVSAIVAMGTALSATRATRRKWYEAKVGKVRLLDSPITLAELRKVFPDWVWLRSVNMFAYVSPERAKALLKRCAGTSLIERSERSRAGGGFGDAKTNALVEKAAVREATTLLKRRGFSVRSREIERIGYDLDATRNRTEWHVEIKGVSGDGMQFLITQAELDRAASDSAFRLMVVTQARTRNARVHKFRSRDLKRRFALTPVSYFAKAK